MPIEIVTAEKSRDDTYCSSVVIGTPLTISSVDPSLLV